VAESKLEEILKKEKPGGDKPGEKEKPEQPDLRTTLERELEGEDSELAKELQRTRAEEIIARRRIAIEAMRSRQPGADTGGARTQERGKEWLTDVAQQLLERGLDPSIVGRTIDYLLGNAQAPMVGFRGDAAPQQGMTFGDMKEIFKMGQEANRTDPAIAAILDKLSQKITDIESRSTRSEASVPKTNYVLVKADGSIQEIEAGKPIILEQKPATGEPLEVVKERHRHAEKMEEIGVERTFKEKLADVVEDIPTNLGKGWAAESTLRHRQSNAPPSSPGTGSVSSFPCTKCKATIFVPPDMPAQVKCAKCGTVYQSDEEVEPAPAPAPAPVPSLPPLEE